MGYKIIVGITGFAQSLEFLKKSGNLQTSFPDLEKVWKIKIKVWKNGKKSGEFFVLKTETSALLPSEFFQVVKSYLKFRLWRKHCRPRSLRSALHRGYCIFTVHHGTNFIY